MADVSYTLYGRANAGSHAVQIVLEEIGAPYAIRWVGRSPEELAAYRRIYPAGKIPALALPDGTLLSESAAILMYLVAAYPAARLAPPAPVSEHGRFLQWMVFMSANVYETALRCYYPERYSQSAAHADAIKAQAVQDYERHLATLEAALTPYVLGANYSAADPYLYMLTGWYPGDLPALLKRLPRLAEHNQRVRERPATRKADQDHAE